MFNKTKEYTTYESFSADEENDAKERIERALEVKAKQAEIKRRAECFPDLLEALQEIKDSLFDHPCCIKSGDVSQYELDALGGDEAFVTYNYQIAKAAIAKALGETK